MYDFIFLSEDLRKFFENSVSIQQLLLDFEDYFCEMGYTYWISMKKCWDYFGLNISCTIGFSGPEKKENLCYEQENIRTYSLNMLLAPKIY